MVTRPDTLAVSSVGLSGGAAANDVMTVGASVTEGFPEFEVTLARSACAGARATTAALASVQDAAQSRVPALGFSVCFAVGNTLLTVWGVVIVLLLR